MTSTLKSAALSMRLSVSLCLQGLAPGDLEQPYLRDCLHRWLTEVISCTHGYTCLQEPQGKLPRINATIENPLGEHDPENSPLCTAFREPGVKAVAIVGNGPLNDAQRKEIDTFDVVVR